jgi:hypothetical protein
MSDGPDLTFDADGFVQMDALPDIDPDVAVTPDELARLQTALHHEAVPSLVDSAWDAMVADVDRIDFGDSIGLVPDDGADLDVHGPSGPIVLVDDDTDAAGPPVDFEPDAIGRPGSVSTGADRSEATAEFTGDTLDPPLDHGALDASDSSWATDDPFTIVGTDDLAPDLSELDTVDDLIDVDVVELHHDDGDPPGTPH